MEKTKIKFNPEDHMENIKGKSYLPVEWRLVWFREEKPNWGIRTEIVENTQTQAVMRAIIFSDDGKIIATAHKKEDKAGFGDFMEKAETGAIGRALAMCGFGTQFSPEFEEGGERIVVDAPQAPKVPQKPSSESTETTRNTSSGKITVSQQAKIHSLYAKKGLDHDTMSELLKKKIKGISSHKDLTKDEANKWIEHLETLPDKPKEDKPITEELNGEVL